MQLRLHKPLFFCLLPAFVLAVVVGTLHHETGHYLAAKCMGLNAHIHYKFTHVQNRNESIPLTLHQQCLFILAGPLQTMLTGTATLVILLIAGKRKWPFSFAYWLLLFITLLWMRQPADFCLALSKYSTTGLYPETGDEAKLSLYSGWPVWSLHVATAFIGLLIIAIILFWFIPAKQRFTFWLAGTIGGAIGFYLWMIWLGKYILP